VHNSTRTLTILVVLAIGGVSALGYMAYRYSKILDDPTENVAVDLVRQVDGFISVRRGMRREVDRHSADGGHLSLSVTRDRALAFYGIDQLGYESVRSAYRQWQAGETLADRSMAAALEHRRGELARLDLGDYESLDR
jgi:hypothetical protein